MAIKEITNKKIWEEFFLPGEDKTFLQSWDWGEVQQLMGNKIWRWGIYDENDLVALVLVFKINARRGRYLLIQHGPVLAKKIISREKKLEILKTLLNQLKEIGQQEKCDFIRIASLWEKNEENQKIFKELGFIKSPMLANAYESTWKLEITPSIDELLSKMRKTTRYLIRQAMKNQEISIEKSNKLNDIEIYQKLNQEVAKRQKFVPFSYEYIKNEFEVFSKDNEVLWFFGKYRGEVVAGALIVFWSGIGFYHQAASLGRYAKLSIPYLIQWEAIKEAKKRGCRIYDFWGYVDPYKFPKHPWAGPTLFKMGFGGRAYQYIETSDMPLSKKYWLIFIFEKLRRLKRGL
ncbi:MAG: lipid II:glycine glycyltransferase FemX [Minisyncoccia bacterium]